MSVKLYVGSLPYETTDDRLKEAFSAIGTVVSASVIIDRMTGRSKGFGFVEMESAEDAQKAIDAFDGKDFDGRKVIVNEARPMEARPPRQAGGQGGFNRGSRDGGYGGNRGGRNW